jgi:hypothetical protein
VNSGSTHYNTTQNVVLFPIAVHKCGKQAGHTISIKEAQKSDQETEGTHPSINLCVNSRTILKLSSTQKVGICEERLQTLTCTVALTWFSLWQSQATS